jgi:hypothetical protein
MERVKDLTEVKVGDKFILYAKYGWKETYPVVVTCDSETKKQCVIGEVWYWKASARPIGGYTKTLYEFTEEAVEVGRKFLRRKFVEEFDYRALADDQCERIYSILQ